MKRFVALVFAVSGLLCPTARADTFTCAFDMMGAPFVTVSLDVVDGQPQSPSTLEHYGQRRASAIEVVEPTDAELVHVWLDADNPGNEIELIIFRGEESDELFPAWLINPQSPYMKKLQSNCVKSAAG